MIPEKLSHIGRHLAGIGIELKVERQPPVGEQLVRQAEQSIGHSLPSDLRDTYLDFANDFEVAWSDGRSETDWDHGRFSLPPLDALVLEYERFHSETVYQYQNPEEFFDDAHSARRVLTRMMNWAVLWRTGGDGDLVCIDLDSESVVYHEREWSFYDPPDNGRLIARHLCDLVEEWGSVCFVDYPGCYGDYPTQGQLAKPRPDLQRYQLAGGSDSREQ